MDALAVATTLSAEAARRRDEGLTAMGAGRFADAARAFADVLDQYPGDLAARALLDAALAAVKSSQDRAAVALSRLAPIRVAPPPFGYVLRSPALVAQQGPPPGLIKISERRNAVTDIEEWLARNGLALPAPKPPNPFRGTPGSLPAGLPTRYGNALLVKAIVRPDHALLLFGPDFSRARYVAALDYAGGLGEAVGARAVLDFALFERAPETLRGDEAFVDQHVDWAELQAGVLYVQTGHSTYARSSHGLNAFITAVDLGTGDLLWQSQPLVAGAGNFLLREGYIICGYGFTEEPDFLYVLDARTGRVASRTPVASGPSLLVEKDGRLFVRTYDTDYVFEIR
ncbi:MAG: hypothetical protein HY744_00085 [Deltaproteobacteria bacterium]|nr:hypothetical protein [Deltaproteobacteria bacterium]